MHNPKLFPHIHDGRIPFFPEFSREDIPPIADRDQEFILKTRVRFIRQGVWYTLIVAHYNQIDSSEDEDVRRHKAVNALLANAYECILFHNPTDNPAQATENQQSEEQRLNFGLQNIGERIIYDHATFDNTTDFFQRINRLYNEQRLRFIHSQGGF